MKQTDCLENAVLVLSYYHPWVAGGGHRPRRFMTEDLRRGKEVCFVYIEPADDDTNIVSNVLDEPNSSLLHLARMLSDGHILFANSSTRWAGALNIDSLLAALRPSLVRVHNPSDHHIALAQRAKQLRIPLLYDQMDLWQDFAVQPWGSHAEAWYLEHADFISTVSAYLSSFHPGRETVVVPNGVTESFIDSCISKRRAKNSAPQFDIVYAGALWPNWMDWPLITDLVARFSSHHWCFVGSVNPPPGEDHGTDASDIMQHLARQPNVTFINEVAHSQLADILTDSRIGLVPFRTNALTLAASPIKVYDYLAAGLTVVSFETADAQDHPRVFRCSNRDQYISAIEFALTRNEFLRLEETKELLKPFTWSMRLQSLESYLNTRLSDAGAR